ncbi:MAG: hypothetical protein ACE369_17605 [Roseovarius sp.]
MATHDHKLVMTVARALWLATREDLPKGKDARKEDFKANKKKYKKDATKFIRSLNRQGISVTSSATASEEIDLDNVDLETDD